MTTASKCARCGRPLTSAASIARGYGRHCLARKRAEVIAAATEGYKPEQIDKAHALIASGGITPMRRPGFYRAESSDGTTAYIVCAQTGHCGCPNGQRSRRYGGCYHVAAARIEWAKTVLRVQITGKAA
ncbi:MAG TPA: DUF6011 domain-containing protein [Streptosporangiaceae bacterium]|nr:DUF6011 domain-containing protein [Streptosporangiaceae bacterium]